jgi:hypothetical protein
MFRGQGANHPSRMQLQALTNILNALGWNNGLRNPTRTSDTAPWWNGVPSSGRMEIFDALSTQYQSDAKIKALFQKARASCHPYTLPCKAQPGNPAHRYQIHASKPFRVRCSEPDCGSKLQRAALVHWVAELVQEGIIDRSQLDV